LKSCTWADGGAAGDDVADAIDLAGQRLDADAERADAPALRVHLRQPLCRRSTSAAGSFMATLANLPTTAASLWISGSMRGQKRCLALISE
jgi:hypothetical protein